MRTPAVALLLLLLWPFCAIAQRNSVPVDSTKFSILENNPQNFQRLLDSSNQFYNNGQYNRSLALNRDILKMAFAMDDPYYIHQGYRYLAYDYLVLNDTLLAVENMRRSEQYAKLAKNDTATAVTNMDLANIYSTYAKYDKAFEFHDRSIRMFEKIQDSTGLAKAHFNAIYTALDSDRLDKAYTHILAAKALDQFGEHHSFGIGVDLFMGEYYLRVKNYEKADEFLKAAMTEAQEHDLKIELENAYAFYSESLYEQGRYKEAYEAFETYDEYSDINSGVFSSAERFDITEKLQLDEYRKDVQAAELQNELQQQIVASKTRLNIVLLSLCITFLILVVTLFFAFRKRKQLVRQLKQKNQEYLAAKEESEHLTKLKSKFFSTVSHELRTPLYGVIGLSTLLLEEGELEKHEKDLRSLKFSADYLLALINDVLQINKIDAEDTRINISDFDLEELLESITASFEYICIQNNNQLRVQLDPQCPTDLKGDAVRLSQVLMNLVGNACKFTENGKISIKVNCLKSNERGNKLRFEVVDTGIGIAEDKLGTIFEEFHQGETLNYNYQGTGLGLPIVKKLLGRVGATIKVDSILGAGSRFYFELYMEDAEGLLKADQKTLLDTSLLEKKRILVAEDNRINQIVTQKILEKHAIDCTVVENGLKAVQTAQEKEFDLILMDLNMPVKDGFDAAREIRMFNPNVPILALTAVEVEEVRNEIYDAGMSDIIVKPYDVSIFVLTLLKHIGQPGRPLNLESSKQVI